MERHKELHKDVKVNFQAIMGSLFKVL